MADTPTIDWPGASGKTYTYYIYPWDADLAAKAGNYCFAKEVSPGKWTPLYFGQTGNFEDRFDGHHKWDCAEKRGATHIHAHLNARESDRLAEESDLVKKWNPPCNG